MDSRVGVAPQRRGVRCAGGLSGFGLALEAVGGPIAAAGFGLLAVLWIVATAQAIRLAMARQIAAHRRWMIRSFAMTFAAVTLRLQLPVLFAIGLDYPEASQILAWTAWVPNLIVVEWLLRRRSNAPATARAGGVPFAPS